MPPHNYVTDPSTGSANINLSRSADPRRVLADRVEQIYSQMPLGIAGSFIISVIAAYELREGRYVEVVVFWAALVVLLTAASLGLYWSFRRSTTKASDAAQWLRWLAISALANGATWGFAGAVFFPSHADEQQVFLAFLLAGMVAGGVPIYAISWPVYALYAAGIVFPFTYVLGTFGNRLFAEIALLVPAFYAMNVGVAWRLNQVFDSGYRLRHAYGKLTEDYTALNLRLGPQVVELEGARRQFEASGRKLALFAERSPIAVFELDDSGRVLTFNPAAENLLGYSSSDTVGRVAADLLFTEAVGVGVREEWRRILESRAPIIGWRLNVVRHDGVEITCDWSLTPLVNVDNRVVSVIVQGRDITQQLEAERIKQEFTSTLSHELRTPLTSIIGSLQLINSGVMGDIEKDIPELTAIAERNGQRLLDLINDILDVEKIESGKLSLMLDAVDVGELVTESLTLNRAFAERFKVKLVATGDLPSTKVNADRKRMLQVMTNLLSNAAKFSTEGTAGEVKGEAGNRNRVRGSVHDIGTGIPGRFRTRIFGRFAQA